MDGSVTVISSYRKWIVYSLMTMAVGAGLGWLLVFSHFHASNLPRVQQPQVGRIYESNSHGHKVYLTKAEANLLQGLQVVVVVSVVLGALLNRTWRVYVDPMEGMTQRQREYIRQGKPPYLR